ncbi:MAG: ArsR family transcriptional regulator [Stygiobacter sp.]|nr:MAG: ArsR family transcriptional regulator [Stygiobacter sp.]
MAASAVKLTLLEQFAKVGKALSNPHRIYILEILSQSERSVEGIATTAGLGIANASQHLQHLRRAGLVSARKSGTQVLYRLSGEDVFDLLTATRGTARRHLADIDRVVVSYMNRQDGMEPISREELLARIREHSVIVLDVRPEEEFLAGHLPGALNIPVKELERRLRELPSNCEVVAYCRGEYCLYAYDAVAALRGFGYRARRLADGFPEWRMAGLPIELAPRS